MNFLKHTPIMIVEEIEPCLSFWEETLGYERTAEVEHEGSLGFVLLASGDVQIMLQSRASLLADLTEPALASQLTAGTLVQYIDVDSMDELAARLSPEMVVIGERKTWYGAREVFVQAPGGFICGFAEHEPQE